MLHSCFKMLMSQKNGKNVSNTIRSVAISVKKQDTTLEKNGDTFVHVNQ